MMNGKNNGCEHKNYSVEHMQKTIIIFLKMEV